MADGIIKFSQRTGEASSLSVNETALYSKDDGNMYKKAYGGDEILIPAGGVWKDWTPTVTSQTGTITSYTANGRVSSVGKLAFLNISLTITDKGTGSGGITITNLPYTVSGLSIMSGRENTVTGKMLQGYVFPSAIYVFNYDNSSPIATGATLRLSGFYEIA